MLLCYRGLYSQHIVDCNNSSLISKNAIQVDKYHYILSLYFYFGRINTLVSLLIYYKFVKKIFLIAIALISIATTQVFGMYGPDSDWIFFLTDGNRFRARADQLGFTLGNDMIKGTFGFRNQTSYHGSIGDMLNTLDGKDYSFAPTISMGIGYTSSVIGIGVGYNATIGNKIYKYNGKAESKPTQAVGHTPVLVLNAMDNAFRMAIPIQVVHLADKYEGGAKESVTAVSVDSQFRYYTGLDFLPQIRLYLRYGYYGWNSESSGTKEKGKMAESFGFDFRLYFGAMVEEVALQPYIKLAYNGALGKQHNQTRVEAIKVLDSAASMTSTWQPTSYTSTYGTSAWDLTLSPALGLTANSDIVSIYLEPSLGLKVTQNGSTTNKNVKEVYGLGYDVYAEIYITPLKNLEWYFEASIGNVNTDKGVAFAGTTGITWYLPAL